MINYDNQRFLHQVIETNASTPVLLLANKSNMPVSNLKEKLQAELTSYSEASSKKAVDILNGNVEVMRGEMTEKNEKGEVVLAEETIVGVEHWITLH